MIESTMLSSEEQKRMTAFWATIIPPIVRRYTLELHFCIVSRRALANAAKITRTHTERERAFCIPNILFCLLQQKGEE